MRHKNGEDRFQTTLLPDAIDDFVASDHPVRVIDAFVDTLNFQELGFTKAQTKLTGRKPYHPGDLLKLYLYGYLNQISTSRRLEKECNRNLEVFWLMRRLAPDFKTIADFRKDNGPAVRGACRAFIQFCRQAGLLDTRLIAIDGSKFKAAASKDQALMRKHIQRDRKLIEEKVDKYLNLLERSDRNDEERTIDRSQVLETLKTLKIKKDKLDIREAKMDELGDNQHCETEPDAKIMRSGRDGMVLGYNLQNAVDANTGLIIHHDLTDEGGDFRQLLPMAKASKEVLGVETLEVLADAGYSNGEHLNSCELLGITATVPRRQIPSSNKDLYQKNDFKYVSESDSFICPAGEILCRSGSDKRRNLYLYKRKGCNNCELQSQCTKASTRTITRHFFEDAYNRSEARQQDNPDLMSQRMGIVERPFGILKQAMGFRRFLCRGIKRAKSEIAMVITTYNIKRMFEVHGVPKLLMLLGSNA